MENFLPGQLRGEACIFPYGISRQKQIVKILDIYEALPGKLAIANKNNHFFLYHSVGDGLNFLQADFGINKTAKILAGLGVQYSIPRC